MLAWGLIVWWLFCSLDRGLDSYGTKNSQNEFFALIITKIS